VSLAEMLRTADLVVTCGPGGVGKTTTGAALGLAAAQLGRRTLVVTVDPARRLADALGIDLRNRADGGHSDDPHRVDPTLIGLPKRSTGSLDALMLDAEATFDRLIRDRAGDQAQAVLDNRIYRSIAGSLAGAQDYMAIERLHQLRASGDYDLIVVDTPPSRHAIDLLEAPDRLASFLGHPVYRAMTAPGKSFAKVTNAATSAFVWTVKRLAGPSIVEETVAFFRSIAAIEAGLRQRAVEMAAALRSPSTSFVVVTSPRAEAIDEADHLAGVLGEGRFSIGAIVVNLVHPLPEVIPDGLEAPEGSALAEQLAHHRELSALAGAERTEIDGLADRVGRGTDVPVTRVPLLDDDVHDVATLLRLAALLSSPAQSA
jgi:anion-transporting  ArsA/GET3 family ATPase